VREAHGNRAAAELAVEICTEFRATLASPALQSPQTQNAITLDKSKDVNLAQAEPVKAKPGAPYFAHLAMCKEDKRGKRVLIQPPLGWMLSKATQDHLGDFLHTCGNNKQLRELETVLRPVPQQTASP